MQLRIIYLFFPLNLRVDIFLEYETCSAYGQLFLCLIQVS